MPLIPLRDFRRHSSLEDLWPHISEARFRYAAHIVDPFRERHPQLIPFLVGKAGFIGSHDYREAIDFDEPAARLAAAKGWHVERYDCEAAVEALINARARGA